MQRPITLLVFSLVALVTVAAMAMQEHGVVDAPSEAPFVSPSTAARLQEHNVYLDRTLTRSVDARAALERHVIALRDEVVEMRASRSTVVAEAQLWRDSYMVLSERFDRLTALTMDVLPNDALDQIDLISAGFERPSSFGVPRPAAAIVR